MDKKILLGFHDEGNLKSLVRLSKASGYPADAVNNLPEMLKLANENQYDLYLMDINLGDSGSTNIAPLTQVYEIVSSRVNSGLAKIVGLSGNDDAVKLAKSKGLPAESKLYFDREKFFGEQKWKR